MADEEFGQREGIDLIIGTDLFYQMLRSYRRIRPGNYPLLQETVLGWTLTVRTPTTTNQHDPQPTFLLREDNKLEQILNRSWEVETLEPSILTSEQPVCEQHFITHTHTTQQDDGRLVFSLPTKKGPKYLGISRLAAERRLEAFERRLEQVLKDQYQLIIRKSKGNITGIQ